MTINTLCSSIGELYVTGISKNISAAVDHDKVPKITGKASQATVRMLCLVMCKCLIKI
ncbi:hypothetical protein [uncultured Psychrobacter sp.]|uniref:hypothetical protein n=1 Tax=uncultured Psychrobacter sp. TaxID=259303 RepID=UPI0025980E1E|nr:hypothetical protein [uncultured Psychrobacter sp.]